MKDWWLRVSRLWRENIQVSSLAPGVDLRVLSGFTTRLSSRERWFVALAGIVGAGTLLAFVVIVPLWEWRTQLQAKVAAKERELVEVVTLASTYDALRRDLAVVGPTNGTLSPFAFLEGLTTSTLGREKLAGINPIGREDRSGVTQEMIELKLSGVSLQELVDLLYKIDATGSALRCTHLLIKKRYKDPYTFDVTLTAVALNS